MVCVVVFVKLIYSDIVLWGTRGGCVVDWWCCSDIVRSCVVVYDKDLRGCVVCGGICSDIVNSGERGPVPDLNYKVSTISYKHFYCETFWLFSCFVLF